MKTREEGGTNLIILEGLQKSQSGFNLALSGKPLRILRIKISDNLSGVVFIYGAREDYRSFDEALRNG
jgi:hypothetical protein